MTDAAAPMTELECLFCRIVAGELPSTRVHEDEVVIAFRDIAPRAPTHILIVPRAHIPSVLELTEADGQLLGRLFAVAAEIARGEGIAGTRLSPGEQRRRLGRPVGRPPSLAPDGRSEHGLAARVRGPADLLCSGTPDLSTARLT